MCALTKSSLRALSEAIHLGHKVKRWIATSPSAPRNDAMEGLLP